MATRNAISRKSYVYADGSTSRSAKPAWSAIQFELFNGRDEEGKPVVDRTVTFDKQSFPDGMIDCAAGHGFSQKLGDELAGLEAKMAKAVEDGEAFESQAEFAEYLLTNMADNLKSGVWVEEGEGGGAAGNVTLLFEAIVAAFAKQNDPIPEERQPALRTKLADKEFRSNARANPHIKVELSRIIAERATERAKAAKELAKTTKADLSAFAL